MIKKFNEFGKINESTDFYETFGVKDAGHLETIERGYIDLYIGDKNYSFKLEMGDGFIDVILDEERDESKKELEELGINFSTKQNYTLFIDDKDFEEYIQDMYNDMVS